MGWSLFRLATWDMTLELEENVYRQIFAYKCRYIQNKLKAKSFPICSASFCSPHGLFTCTQPALLTRVWSITLGLKEQKSSNTKVLSPDYRFFIHMQASLKPYPQQETMHALSFKMISMPLIIMTWSCWTHRTGKTVWRKNRLWYKTILSNKSMSLKV